MALLTRTGTWSVRPRTALGVVLAPALAAAAALLAPTAGAVAARSIAEIQGTGPSSPFAGQTVLTSGVVTASYPTGGFRGFVIQTPGTGGVVDLATHTASDGLFVYLGASTDYPSIGAHVSVSGPVSEFHGLTEVAPPTGGVSPLPGSVVAPRPAQVRWPRTEARRESLESMIMAPVGRYSVSDNYALNRYAEVGLARGGRPLPQPTDVARPGSAAAAVTSDDAARSATLDDGASIDFLPPGGGDNQDIALPYLRLHHPVRGGAAVRFTAPVVIDYRNDAWKLQPTSQVTAANPGVPATFANTRTWRPRRVGGSVRVASFNVLNYFTETGEDWVAAGGTCTWYDDRDGEHVTVRACSGDGPRGAADEGDLGRQQAKIVRAVNRLGADVLSLEEIESATYAGVAHRDDALATLVHALNRAAGRTRWVRPVGASRILVGSPAFANAREPLAQQFQPRGATRALHARGPDAPALRRGLHRHRLAPDRRVDVPLRR